MTYVCIHAQFYKWCARRFGRWHVKGDKQLPLPYRQRHTLTLILTHPYPTPPPPRAPLAVCRHHDTIPELETMPCGPRVYTFFLYLSDVEEGGGTSMVHTC